MAKALIGYLPATSASAQEVASLRRRVADLEELVARLTGENDALVAAYLALHPADDPSVLTPEHASV